MREKEWQLREARASLKLFLQTWACCSISVIQEQSRAAVEWDVYKLQQGQPLTRSQGEGSVCDCSGGWRVRSEGVAERGVGTGVGGLGEGGVGSACAGC